MRAASASPAPDAAVVGEWRRRIEAEYRSSAITQELTLWLTQQSAPPGLLHEGLRVADDEVVHAELSLSVFHQAGGEDPPQIRADSLGAPRPTGRRDLDTLYCTLRNFCLGETVAVRLFRRLREGCTVPVARTALDRILVDEVRHREFGWTTLEWLLSTPQGPELRAQAERMLPGLLAQQRAEYGGAEPSSGDAEAPFPEARRAWGLMPPSAYRATLRECHAKDYARLFAELEIAIPEAPTP